MDLLKEVKKAYLIRKGNKSRGAVTIELTQGAREKWERMEEIIKRLSVINFPRKKGIMGIFVEALIRACEIDINQLDKKEEV